ncbi:MAG: hypothetical protein ACHRXM_27305 [Isosphaerales bacterium]
MAYFGQIVLLAAAVTFAITSFCPAVAGIVSGRLNIGGDQPWVVFREHPVKFLALMLWELSFAFMFAVAAVRVASGILR